MYRRAAFSADPSAFYDLDAYHAAIRGLLGIEFNGQNWSYPPSRLLLAAPFGQLSYLAALACWTLLGVAGFIAVAGQYVSDWRILIPVLLSPAAAVWLLLRLRASPGPGLLELQKPRQSALRIDRAQLFSTEN